MQKIELDYIGFEKFLVRHDKTQFAEIWKFEFDNIGFLTVVHHQLLTEPGKFNICYARYGFDIHGKSSFSMYCEDDIDQDFIRKELQYLLDQYNWRIYDAMAWLNELGYAVVEKEESNDEN